MKVEPVDGAPYVFSIDISDIRWEGDIWDILVSGEIPGLGEPTPYPYGSNPSGLDADPALQVVAKLTQADWFVGNAGQPLHYKFLLGLPDNVRELERDILGVNLNRAIRDRDDVIRLGFLEGSSGVSKNNRLLDRIDLPNGGYYWLSYDFDRPVRANSPRRLKDFPLGPEEALPHMPAFEHDGGEMLFSLPNGLQGYYLTDPGGNYLEKGPVEVVFHPVEAGYLSPVFGPEIANGAGCMACHLNGVIPAVDQIKDAVISEGLLPPLGEQREYFEALYVDKATVRAAMEDDITRYLAALEKVDGDPGLKTDLQGPGIFHEEPVTNLMSVYFEPVTREKLAAELGFTFGDLQARTQELANADRAKNILSSWFVALETRGVVERSEVERNFQIVYAALHGTEPKRESERGTIGKMEIVEVEPGAAYTTRHGLRVAPVKGTINVCERAQIVVETDKACHLQVIFPDEQSGKLVYHELPEDMLGGDAVLHPGERRILPSRCDNCPQLVANQPSAGWEIHVNCFAGDVPPIDMTRQMQEAAEKTVYQSASIMFADATENVSERVGIEAPISATARFVTLEDTTAKISQDGQCLEVK